MNDDSDTNDLLGIPDEIHNLHLEELQIRYERGDKVALFRAIGYCGKNNLLLPEWLIQSFCDSWYKWVRYDVKTLGEAFEIEWPKGKSLAAAKKKRNKEFEVYTRITRLHEGGESIDEALFQKVGHDLGLGKTLTSEYYYSVKQLIEHGAPFGVKALLAPFVVTDFREK